MCMCVCLCTPYMTVYLVISLPKIPHIHRINMVLANPTHNMCVCACVCEFPTHSNSSFLAPQVNVVHCLRITCSSSI